VDTSALFVGDILTTGVYAAGRRNLARDTVAGGRWSGGFFAIQAARAGVREVTALDPSGRLALASWGGAIDVRARNAQTAVDERTGGRGADVVIDAVGSAQAFERALDVARRGGTIVVVGMYTSEVVPAQIGVWWTRAITVRFAGICPVHAWWDRAMDAVRAGAIDPDPLVSHRLPLQDAALGYELFDTHRATKVLLLP
jgi:threonine dehydrogenase-like Zn-dependent dehydrogenase